MITSAGNPKVKLLRSLQERKQRRQQQRCLIEGIRLVAEALASGVAVDPVLFAPERLSLTAAGRAMRQRLEHLHGAEEIDDIVLRLISDTIHSQGVVAAAAIPAAQPVTDDRVVLVLDGIADPGNAGTMLRTAWAGDAGAVLALGSTTDLWSPKALRAGMGAHFHLNIQAEAAADWPAGRQVLIAAAGNGVPYWEVDWSLPTAVIIGSEAHGASPVAQAAATNYVTIPMAPGAESLNAAAAAAILLFEARRQSHPQSS